MYYTSSSFSLRSHIGPNPDLGPPVFILDRDNMGLALIFNCYIYFKKKALLNTETEEVMKRKDLVTSTMYLCTQHNDWMLAITVPKVPHFSSVSESPFAITFPPALVV